MSEFNSFDDGFNSFHLDEAYADTAQDEIFTNRLKHKKLIKVLAIISLAFVLSNMIFSSMFMYVVVPGESIYSNFGYDDYSTDGVYGEVEFDTVYVGDVIDIGDDFDLGGSVYIIEDEFTNGTIKEFLDGIYVPQSRYELQFNSPEPITVLKMILCLSPIVLLCVYIFFFMQKKAKVFMAVALGILAYLFASNVYLYISYDLSVTAFMYTASFIMFALAMAAVLGKFAMRPLVIVACSLAIVPQIVYAIEFFPYYIDDIITHGAYLEAFYCIDTIGWILFYITVILFVANHEDFKKVKRVKRAEPLYASDLYVAPIVPAPTSEPAPASEPESNVKKIEKALLILADMRNRGVISEEEYQAKRDAVLKKL